MDHSHDKSYALSLTDRYKLLYSPPHQLDFVGLQLELLIAFHHDLADAAAGIQPLSRQQAAYLNTALYIAMVMTEWGEQTVRHFFDVHFRPNSLCYSFSVCPSSLVPYLFYSSS